MRFDPPAGKVAWACCAPGDAVLIHPKVVYGGAMNRSAAPRRNIVLQVGDAAAPLVVRLDEPEAVCGAALG